MEIIISGYSQDKRVSIEKLYFDEDAGVTQTLWSDTPVSPSFICATANVLFVGLEHSNGGEILFYMANGEQYRRVNRVKISGGELCHLFYSRKYGLIYGSCYQDGNIAIAEMKDDKLHLVGEIKGEGNSRSHCCVESPDGQYIYTTNIAQDRIYCYIQSRDGIEQNTGFPYFQFENGEGPRHMAFCEKTDRLYLITEYSSMLHVFNYDNKTGELILLDSCSTLSAEFLGESFGSSIAISKNGERIYCANRGANTIAVFDISETDRLKKVQEVSCGGDFPRHIALSYYNKHLLSANQRSNNVTAIEIDDDGMLGEISAVIPFEAPSYVEDVTYVIF